MMVDDLFTTLGMAIVIGQIFMLIMVIAIAVFRGKD